MYLDPMGLLGLEEEYAAWNERGLVVCSIRLELGEVEERLVVWVKGEVKVFDLGF